MKTSRQQILEYIQKKQLVTASELSGALHMTDANARHHLTILENRGDIERIGQRSQPGKGRPSIIYGLSERSKGDNLDLLCIALLDQVSSMTQLGQDQFLTGIVKRLLLQAEKQPGASAPLTQRLYHAIHLLNQYRYQARWEARHESPIIILEHCPYARILDQHPEICRMDALLLSHLLEVPVEQTAKLVKDKSGAIQCRFRLLRV